MQENRSAYRLDQEGFLRKSQEAHGNKYDYSKAVYVNQRTKVCIICPIHGEFWQTPKNHMKGQGCPECGKMVHHKKYNIVNFIESKPKKRGKIPQKYNLLYLTTHNPLELDILPFDGFKGLNDHISVKCPIHGLYDVVVRSFIKGGGKCKLCVLSSQQKKKRLTVDEVRSRIEKMYGKQVTGFYDTFVKSNVPMKFKCNVCNREFMRRPAIYLHGPLTFTCPYCGKEKISQDQTKTNEQFILDAQKIHGDKYDYSQTKYISSNEHVDIVCKECGYTFSIEANSHLQGHGCPRHMRNTSTYELELCQWLSDNNIQYIRNCRDILDGDEIDIYLPEQRIAFEINGIFWHNELYKPSDYHLNKTVKCEKHNIRLIHIFEDEWLDSRNKWLSMLSNILGLGQKRIFARKCVIKEVGSTEAVHFLDTNHLQGKSGSQIRYGLYYNNELVSLMTFGKTRHFIGGNNHQYELLRFCNKLNTSVIGGASRLFKHFIKIYNPQSVVSYADRRWSIGGLYENLGFTLYNKSRPNYYYVIKNKRMNRFNYRKSVLVKKYNCPVEMSEKEFCQSQKWYRIYDCGCLCFEWKK